MYLNLFVYIRSGYFIISAGVGFIIYRVANLQKNLFRQNPGHPAVQRKFGVTQSIVHLFQL